MLSRNKVDHTPCFTQLKKVRCVQGKFPEKLTIAWEKYEKETGVKQDHPSVFEPSQTFVIIEMEHGGDHLGSYVFVDAKAAFQSLLW